jgi:hypothetical protein
VLELVKGGFNISRHGDVDVSIVIVTVDGDATVEFASPVGCVETEYSSLRALSRCCALLRPTYLTPKLSTTREKAMLRVEWVQRPGVQAVGAPIAELGEVFLELLVSNEPRLFQAIHAATDFGVDPSISRGGNIVKVVLGDNLVRDDIQSWEAHVFVAVHRGAKVEIADVKNSEARIRG